MRLAFIAGPSAVRQISSHGDFDFCLAHVLKQEIDSGKDVGYAKYFRDRAQGRVCIMDNSAFELGQPMFLPELKHYAQFIEPDYVVVPDFWRDSMRTIAEFITARHYLNTVPFKFMAVAHGKTLDETVACVTNLRTAGADLVAVSKLYYDDYLPELDKTNGIRLMLSRIEFCKRLEKAVGPRIDRSEWFYMLGCSEPAEIYFQRDRKYIWGNDSTSALVHAQHGIELRANLELLGMKRITAKLDFLRDLSQQEFELVKLNIGAFKSLRDELESGLHVL